MPWLALAVFFTMGPLLAGARFLSSHPVTLPVCPLKSRLGLPCLTCGLTRCLLAAAGGHWHEAFHWHPVALLMMLASPLAAAWDLLRAWHGADYPALPDSLRARLAVAAALVATWLIQVVRGI